MEQVTYTIAESLTELAKADKMRVVDIASKTETSVPTVYAYMAGETDNTKITNYLWAHYKRVQPKAIKEIANDISRR